MGKCEGVNKNGNNCGNYASKGSKMCRFHSFIENSSFNDECPICFESETKNDDSNSGNNMYILNCLHKIHEECCKGLNKLECPICRTAINNFPKSLHTIITNNEIKYRNERDEEERQRIIENESTNIRYTPQLEVASAIYYLKDELNIPSRFLPESISLITDLAPPEGVIFQMIVSKVLNDINNLIFKDIHIYSAIFGEDCWDEEEENDIFPEEGMSLEILQPKFEMRRHPV